jgi:hypothetical protein
MRTFELRSMNIMIVRGRVRGRVRNHPLHHHLDQRFSFIVLLMHSTEHTKHHALIISNYMYDLSLLYVPRILGRPC